MSYSITFAQFIPDNRDNGLPRTIVDPSYLQPFDGLQVVLEQALVTSYLDVMSGFSEINNELKDAVRKWLFRLPQSIHSQDPNLDSLYLTGIEMVHAILEQSQPGMKQLHFPSAHPVDILTIFRHPLTKNYVNDEYTATIPLAFVTEYLSYFCGWYDRDAYPEGILEECALYRPSMKVVAIHNLGHDEKFRSAVAIDMSGIGFTNFDLSKSAGDLACPHCFMSCFNMQDISADGLIAILASFSLDHFKYDMTTDSSVPFRIADICFDLVTGSSYTRADGAGTILATEKDLFIQALRSQLEKGRINKISDYGLFGELLKRLGEDSDLINYFTQPITHITAAEAYAFRTSIYAQFIAERMITGMEATDETAPEDAGDDSTSEDTPADSTDPDATADDTAALDPAADPAAEVTDTEEDKSPAQPPSPTIDPKQMLLELAQPTETMSDYVYREMVSKRISNILKNPPENARPNDLLMLKRWKSRWLYLASIACLRDFLTRVSIRLSNN